MFSELTVDWFDDSDIRRFIKTRIGEGCDHRKRIMHQAIESMTNEEMHNDIKVLSGDSIVFDDDIKSNLQKLVRRCRKTQHRQSSRKKIKRRRKNPSRDQKVKMTTCGINKRVLLNKRDKRQRKEKASIQNAAVYVSTENRNPTKQMSDIDAMRFTCLQHGGIHLDRYDWGVEGITKEEKHRRQKAYFFWQSREKKMKPLTIVNFKQFDLKDPIQREANIALFEFEHRSRNFTTGVCNSCKEWLFLDHFKENVKCPRCKRKNLNEQHFIQHNIQPIWYDENQNVQYHVPKQLTGLTIYEELLIQKASPYIPVINVYNGSLGLKGHCIVFERESQGDISKLPRCESEIVCFNRQYGTKECGHEMKQMTMTAKKTVVLNALTFLKTNNKVYYEIDIVPPVAATIKGKVEFTLNDNVQHNEKSVSSSYCHDVGSTDITYSTVDSSNSVVPENNADVAFVDDLKKTVKKSNLSVPIFDFPPTKKEPLRSVNILLITRIFLHLFL